MPPQPLEGYGAELILTDPLEGSDGAIRKVREIYESDPDAYFYPDQYNNPENWKAHYETTGREILEQTNGSVTHFVAGLGTGGTFRGTGTRLRQERPEVKLIFDALSMEWRTVKVHKNPDCPVCGGHPSVTELIDYEEFCGIRGGETETQTDREITVKDLKRKLDAGEDVVILDVREPHEYQISRLPDSRLIPIRELNDRLSELSTADDLVVHCSFEAAGYAGGYGYWLCL